MSNITKSAQTITDYLHRGQCLWMRAALHNSTLPSELKPADFISWLETQLPKFKPATRRQYIASSREWLANMKEANIQFGGKTGILEDAIKYSLNMKSDHYTPVEKLKQWRGNTSNQKTKKISTADMKVLASNKKNIKGKWIMPALVWMSANISVGLRPTEWRTAYLEDEDDLLNLVVRNAKNTNQRAHGEFRHINISQLMPQKKRLIEAQLLAIKYFVKDDASWATYYDGVRCAIRRLARENLPSRRKYPTLYSSRHQFAANAKSEGLTKVEVAALMGHATDETATMHYGKKKHGSGSCSVKASREDIKKIKLKSAKKPIIENMHL